MAKVCNKGFDQEAIKHQRDFYGIAYTQNIVSGRWKFLILWYLKENTRRYHEIKLFLNDISQGSLTKQLRELEQDGIIERVVYPEVPPRVEYSLSPKGKALLPMLEFMRAFGDQFGEQVE